jgi:hypothetical protein
MSEGSKSWLRFLLGWTAMLLLAASVGSLAVPGLSSLTLKLVGAAVFVIILWLIFPKGKHHE